MASVGRIGLIGTSSLVRILLLVETSLRLIHVLLLVSVTIASLSKVEACVFLCFLRSLESDELRVVFFVWMAQFVADLD